MKCSFKKNGKRCNAHSMKSEVFCFTHNPKTAKDKLEAVRKGGLAPKPRMYPTLLPPFPLENVDDVRGLIADTINRIRTEPLTHHQANAIGFLAGIAVRIFEHKGEIDKSSHGLADGVLSALRARRTQEEKLL